MKRFGILWIGILLTFISFPDFAGADVPLLINYRGYVDVSEPSIGLPTGSLTIDLEFNLYDSAEIEGATPLWTETQTAQLLDGNFAVMLGNVNPLSQDLFSSSQRYLTVSVGGNVVAGPQQILSVPYAMQAGNVFSTASGKVGIGTTNPTAKLEVEGNIRSSGKVITGSDVAATGALTGDSVTSNGLIQSNSGGFKFPDGTTQTTQAIGDGHSLDAADGSPVNVVYVNNQGRVGIGTTSPQTKLDVNGAIAGFGIVPIGSIIPWHKSLPGVPTLPEGWVECNGQVLDDILSPLNGQTLPDLNAAGRFLRGATESGIIQEDMMQEHTHLDSGHSHLFQVSDYGYPDGCSDRTPNYYWMNPERGTWEYKGTYDGYANLGSPSTFGGNVPRVGSETRPVNMSVVWVMRVK